MAVYCGPPIESGPVALVAPIEARLGAALSRADLPEQEKSWFARARTQDDLLYVFVVVDGEPAGQIVLHDIDWEQHEAMVGYHIFRPEQRGSGYGTAALAALCRYAFEERGLRRLVMITLLDNAASRRIAEKCRFREIGPAREGPHLVAYERRGIIDPA